MVKAIVIHEYGGPEVLRWEDVEIRRPGDGEIRVKNLAIRLHSGDVDYRKGVLMANRMPFIPGTQAVGEVVEMGPGVTGIQVGDIVGHASVCLGAYAEEQVLPAQYVVPVPTSIDPTLAVSVLAMGATAHFLLRRCASIKPGNEVLIHEAAEGFGPFLSQLAHDLGARVIGTVLTQVEAIQAKDDGCQHVIVLTAEDFVSRVNEITRGHGVKVVYDRLGNDTFEKSVDCLTRGGLMVSIGQKSGTPGLIPTLSIAIKSLYVTSPNLHPQFPLREEQLEAAEHVFANVASGKLRVRSIHKYPLFRAAQAHDDLEKGKLPGSVVLIPSGI